jgi:hypothetical protein
MTRMLKLLVGAAALPAMVCASPTTLPIYINSGTIATNPPPQIDATAFLNLGTFQVLLDTLPYDFSNTLYFTNRGVMIGAPGFRFDYTDDRGIRRPAATFVNTSVGQIAGLEFLILPDYWGPSRYVQTMLLISATNVTSSGYLGVGNGGIISINGRNVDLSRGGIEVQSMATFGTSILDTDQDNIPDSFYSESGMLDTYWGSGLQDPPPLFGPINTSTILRSLRGGYLASTPRHAVTNLNGQFFTSFSTYIPPEYLTAFANTGVVASVGLTLTNQDGSVTNIVVPTNIFRQAVLVGLTDTNFTVRTRFGYPGPAGLGFGTVVVELASQTTNAITGLAETDTIYFVDYLGYDTNTLSLTNLSVWVPTQKPYAYRIVRTEPFEFTVGANGNTRIFNDIIYSTSFSNVFATNLYAAYSGSIDYLESRPPPVPGADVTNLTGRIEISADTLDLTKARIRGMSTLNINARHLKSSAGAQVEAENLIYNLTSTNGLLSLQGLSKESVHRVRGDLFAWTGIWSNQFALVFSNWFIDPNTNYFNPVTNAVDVNLYCLILSADFLTRTQQVVAHTLALNSTNVVINDPFLVSTRMNIAAEGLTVNSNISLGGALVNWTHDLTPGLKFLTNNGTINVANVAYYGGDYPTGRQLLRLVNTGTLQAEAHEIACDLFQDSGTVQNANNLRVFANTAIFQGSYHGVGGGAHYSGQDYKLRNHRLVASRGWFINVTNSFADAGPASNNSIELADGFHLLRKPRYGDLLGSTILTRAARFVSVAHTWAAEDRGARATGFADNVAIGRLQLDSQPGGELRFGPPTDGLGLPLPGNYALYVDYLEFSTNRVLGLPSVADDPEGYIVIEPGLTIYFAASNLNAEDLDGRFEGRLRWVKEFAGPNSGVDVALRTGRTIRVNIGLVDSRNIDSDGDGLVNAYDIYPFDDVLITDFEIESLQPFAARLQWRAAARTTYQIERATNLGTGDWTVIGTLGNDTDEVRLLTVRDTETIGTNAGPRFYRVRYEP